VVLGRPVGDVEGLVAEGLLVEGLAVDGDPVEPAPVPDELLELPELLCAIATPPDNSKAASVAAVVTFIVNSMVAPGESTNRDDARSTRLRNARWKVPGNMGRNRPPLPALALRVWPALETP
jgi:hypothetical protein